MQVRRDLKESGETPVSPEPDPPAEVLGMDGKKYGRKKKESPPPTKSAPRRSWTSRPNSPLWWCGGWGRRKASSSPGRTVAASSGGGRTTFRVGNNTPPRDGSSGPHFGGCFTLRSATTPPGGGLCGRCGSEAGGPRPVIRDPDPTPPLRGADRIWIRAGRRPHRRRDPAPKAPRRGVRADLLHEVRLWGVSGAVESRSGPRRGPRSNGGCRHVEGGFEDAGAEYHGLPEPRRRVGEGPLRRGACVGGGAGGQVLGRAGRSHPLSCRMRRGGVHGRGSHVGQGVPTTAARRPPGH